MMRSGALIALLTLTLACSGGSGLFRQYEYEEESYLALDGSATMYVNSSVQALNALRGSTFDTNPQATPARADVSAFFETDGVRVTRITFSRRNNRRYLHVRLAIDDVRRLGATRPFGWSSYSFAQDGSLMVYRQRVGAPVASAAAPGWTGDELVAFRIHVPSKIPYHNAGADNLKRGNILVWEQSLADRLAGRPLEIEARMETRSILYRTLWLFGATILAVAVMFGLLLLWIVRGRAGRPRRAERVEATSSSGAGALLERGRLRR
jgi:hypothetical protein